MSKPERILEAALEVIAEKGPHETTIDEIAHRAGVAKGTVYLYFKNKDSLFASLMRAGLESFESAVRRQTELHTSPTEQLQAIIREHVVQMHHHIKFRKMMWNQAANTTLPRDVMDVLRESAKSYIDLVTSVLQRGHDEGALYVTDARLTARAIIGSLNQAVFDITKPNDTPDPEATIRLVSDFIFNGVRPGGN